MGQLKAMSEKDSLKDHWPRPLTLGNAYLPGDFCVGIENFTDVYFT